MVARPYSLTLEMGSQVAETYKVAINIRRWFQHFAYIQSGAGNRTTIFFDNPHDEGGRMTPYVVFFQIVEVVRITLSIYNRNGEGAAQHCFPLPNNIPEIAQV